MSTLPSISLDEHWQVRYFPIRTDDLVDGYAGSVPAITEWAGLESPDSIVWIWRPFYLEPTNICVRYYLSIDSRPSATGIVVNDYQLVPPNTPLPLKVDITDYVMLEENIIALRVTSDGKFGHISLLPIPCDEL
jgi:hypothetical protein